jgi:hypothetical protein
VQNKEYQEYVPQMPSSGLTASEQEYGQEEKRKMEPEQLDG